MSPQRAVVVAAATAVAATITAAGAAADWATTAAGVGAFLRGGGGPAMNLVAPRVPPSAVAVDAAAATTTTVTTTDGLLSAAAEQPPLGPSQLAPPSAAAAAAAAVVATARRSTPAWWTARQVVDGGGAPAPPPRSLYVNVGGGFVNFEGHTWVADTDPLGGGAPADTRVFGSAPPGLPALFTTNRYAQGVSMAFTRTVAAASAYRVELLWAELFMTEAAARFMDVFVSVDGLQPVAVVTRLDVFAAVGGDAPLRLAYPPAGSPAMPIDSTITITLQRSDLAAPGASNVFLSAFSIVEEPLPTPQPTPTTTPNPANPARIGAILAAAKAAADGATPAVRAAARWVAATDRAVATAAADRQRVTPRYEAAPRTDALAAAWAAYGTATTTFQDEVRVFSDAAPTVGARHRMVTAALTAVRDYAAGLSPPVCAYLQAPGGSGGGSTAPVTAAEIQTLDGFAAGVAAEVAALRGVVADVGVRHAAVEAAAEALRGALGHLRAALPLEVV